MSDNDLAERICRLPVDFYGGSKSMSQLVAESGITACFALLTVDNLSAYLAAHQDLCEQWLRWSANKRATSGWYFKRHADNFVVGFYPRAEVLTVRDPAVACAEFVVREVAALAKICRKS
jgi:ubiquinone biosynthesis protein COQ9